MRACAVALLLAGCATAGSGGRDAPRARYTLDVSSIHEGLNCFPIEPIRSERCAWRLKSAADELLSRMLDRALAGRGGDGWRARFDLDDVRYFTSPTEILRPDLLVATYRFTLVDPAGRQVLAVSERVIKDWDALEASRRRGRYEDERQIAPPAGNVVAVGDDVYFALVDVSAHLRERIAAALGPAG